MSERIWGSYDDALYKSTYTASLSACIGEQLYLVTGEATPAPFEKYSIFEFWKGWVHPFLQFLVRHCKADVDWA